MTTGERVVPVVVKVHEGGRVRTVKVGQAFVTDAEVVLSLDPITLQLQPEVEKEAAPVVTSPPKPASGQLADLEWLAQRSRRILEDPRKQRWHEDTRLQLSRIEAEMERLRERAAPH